MTLLWGGGPWRCAPEPRMLSLLACPIYNRFMIKRAQGRKRFGMKNFKKRWFRLTNHEFTYQKSKGNEIPLFPCFHLFSIGPETVYAPLGSLSAFLD